MTDELSTEELKIALQAFWLKWKHEVDAYIMHCKVMLRRGKEGLPKDSRRDYLADKKNYEHSIKFHAKAYNQIRKLLEQQKEGEVDEQFLEMLDYYTRYPQDIGPRKTRFICDKAKQLLSRHKRMEIEGLLNGLNQILREWLEKREEYPLVDFIDKVKKALDQSQKRKVSKEQWNEIASRISGVVGNHSFSLFGYHIQDIFKEVIGE